MSEINYRREAFEQWSDNRLVDGKGSAGRHRMSDGKYCQSHVNDAWKGWKAAIDASATAKCALDREALEKLIQRHASAYVARGAAISDSIIAECKASRDALLAALSAVTTRDKPNEY
jgi:hypothetical protein